MYVEMVTMRVRPDQVPEFLAGRSAAMAAIGERYPALRSATLARLDEERWVDWVLWDSLEQAQAAAEQAPGIAAVAGWLALIEGVQAMEHGTIEHHHAADRVSSVASRG